MPNFTPYLAALALMLVVALFKDKGPPTAPSAQLAFPFYAEAAA